MALVEYLSPYPHCKERVRAREEGNRERESKSKEKIEHEQGTKMNLECSLGGGSSIAKLKPCGEFVESSK